MDNEINDSLVRGLFRVHHSLVLPPLNELSGQSQPVMLANAHDLMVVGVGAGGTVVDVTYNNLVGVVTLMAG